MLVPSAAAGELHEQLSATRSGLGQPGDADGAGAKTDRSLEGSGYKQGLCRVYMNSCSSVIKSR